MQYLLLTSTIYSKTDSALKSASLLRIILQSSSKPRLLKFFTAENSIWTVIDAMFKHISTTPSKRTSAPPSPTKASWFKFSPTLTATDLSNLRPYIHIEIIRCIRILLGSVDPRNPSHSELVKMMSVHFLATFFDTKCFSDGGEHSIEFHTKVVLSDLVGYLALNSEETHK